MSPSLVVIAYLWDLQAEFLSILPDSGFLLYSCLQGFYFSKTGSCFTNLLKWYNFLIFFVVVSLHFLKWFHFIRNLYSVERIGSQDTWVVILALTTVNLQVTSGKSWNLCEPQLPRLWNNGIKIFLIWKSNFKLEIAIRCL